MATLLQRVISTPYGGLKYEFAYNNSKI